MKLADSTIEIFQRTKDEMKHLDILFKKTNGGKDRVKELNENNRYEALISIYNFISAINRAIFIYTS